MSQVEVRPFTEEENKRFESEEANENKICSYMKTNLLELHQHQPAPFINEKIANVDDIFRQKGVYVWPETRTLYEDVSTDKIIGHTQIYDTLSWGEGLEGKHFKRMERNLAELAKNPEYYLEETCKSGVGFTKVEDEYYINVGKHRVIIARFLEHYNPDIFAERGALRNVEVVEHIVDTEFTKLANDLKIIDDQSPHLRFILDYVSANDQVCLTAIHGQKMQFYTRKEALQFVAAHKSPSLMKKLSGHKGHTFISYQQCFKALFAK